MGVVYLIHSIGTENKDENNIIRANYKIGCSKTNATKRKDTLQTGNPNELEITHVFKTEHPFKLEKMLHNHYKNNHLLNEWFELTNEEVLNFIEICKKHNNTIIFLLEAENPFF